MFNTLTGLNQRVGNFPGVTVDKKAGTLSLEGQQVELIDFPGCYSLYPNSRDERVVVSTLTDASDDNYPDAAIYVVDVNHLERHLLLATQVIDLQIPIVLALNMSDQAEKGGLTVDVQALSQYLGVPVVSISARYKQGIDHLLQEVKVLLSDHYSHVAKPIYKFEGETLGLYQEIALAVGSNTAYAAKVVAHHYEWLPHLTVEQRADVQALLSRDSFDNLRGQVQETMQRYDTYTPAVRRVLSAAAEESTFTDALDRLLTHRRLGPLIFMAILFFVFQAVYSWATGPMDTIDSAFVWLGARAAEWLPEAWYTDLLVEGVLAGLGGVVIFIPQIAILFLLISILEEVGYMARAVFMFDGIMQKVGLNGRSIIALVSSGACAIPAIMSTRTISNRRERIITILVAPLISCSARIPVYVVLVAFVVPEGRIWLFDQQGLIFMGLYTLGIVAALAVAYICKLLMKSEETSHLLIELPRYRVPSLLNIWSTIRERVMAFVVEAGKVIMVISVILWFMASYGPSEHMEETTTAAEQYIQTTGLQGIEADDYLASQQLESSYAGLLGKSIEPLIRPLGFDWKMGIALITSFAAREVFVGTMATIYSVGSSDDEASLRTRMRAEIRPSTGRPMYDMPTALSLLIFYVFAMQCMSTLAVTYKETRSWKWPIIQFTYMTGLAYLGSLLVYQLLS